MARVYQTSEPGRAHVRAAIVAHPGEADLCVHRVTSWAFARGDALWYITRNREQATVWVHFGSIGYCQVRVCFVDTFEQAGWRRPHALKGRFG